MKTVTVAVAAVANKVEETVAWICVAVMFVTERFVCVVVFQRTCEPPEASEVRRKFVPTMVRVRAALPAAAVLGVTLVTVGMGLGMASGEYVLMISAQNAPFRSEQKRRNAFLPAGWAAGGETSGF